MIQGRQGGTLLPFHHHHAVTEVLGVLFERRQLGKGFLAHEETLQSGECHIVQGTFDEVFQASAFRHESLADDRLQRGIAGPHDLSGGQESEQFVEMKVGRSHPASPGRRPSPATRAESVSAQRR